MRSILWDLHMLFFLPSSLNTDIMFDISIKILLLLLNVATFNSHCSSLAMIIQTLFAPVSRTFSQVLNYYYF